MLIRFAVSALMLIAAMAAAEDRDPVMGNWKGESKHGDGAAIPLTAKSIAWGNDEYEIVIKAEIGGDSKEFRLKDKATRGGAKATIKSKLDAGPDLGGMLDSEFTFENGKCTGTCKIPDGEAKITLERVEIKPPTLGAKAPEGAVVLFDGTVESLAKNWVDRKGEPAPWKVEDGYMEVAKTDILTKEKLTNAEIHVEFMTPFMPTKRGQGRGNSGVYVQGLYEVQVLDSFGLAPADNEAGGIYKLAIPKVNASLPPGEWQTYDITFHAAKYVDGKMTEPAEITVLFNGEVIHDKAKLPHTTPGGIGNDPTKPGGILLQNHGNPVRYRNIWIKSL